MTSPLPSPLAEQVETAFWHRYGERPRLFCAPGRVNLIGEHTDYNDGFVLPMAIDRSTWVAATPRADRRVELHSLNLHARAHFDLDGPAGKQSHQWSAYVEGIARVLDKWGARPKGANLVIATDIPLGAGLSSSAALEIAAGLALLSVSGHEEVDRVQLARAGQKAEHDYVGTKCGIMDQYVSAMARVDHALLIDCRSLDAKQIPMKLTDHALLILDTGVKHELATSAYNQRRAECEEGTRLLRRALPNIRALRDVTPKDLEQHEHLLPDPIRRRVRHVVHENERTLRASRALKEGNLTEVGRLMAESHQSLRDDYEVSCPELDTLVEAVTGQPGVIGSRMTGGGFGGSTITIVRKDAVESVIAKATELFAQRHQRDPRALLTTAAAGAREL
ncbi:MAG: galactokinase [Myxococcaceae bacterium]|nr:galactokinase [Myxococcaceae bacterium]